MHIELAAKRDEVAELCRRYGVKRLEVFGSGARSADFDPARSDFDFLVEFAPAVSGDIATFMNFQEALQNLLTRPVDLVARRSVDRSANYIRRRAILRDIETLYG